MQDNRGWLATRYTCNPNHIKCKKQPVDPISFNLCDGTDYSISRSYDEVKKLIKGKRNHGLALQISSENSYFFIDIDTTDRFIQHEFLNKFSGCYIEVSHSLQGLHIIGTVNKSMLIDHCNKNNDKHLEFYVKSRFCAITEKTISGCNLDNLGHEVDINVLNGVLSSYFAPPVVRSDIKIKENFDAKYDDNTILNKALDKKSMLSLFGAKDEKACFSDLFYCNKSMLSKNYPDPKRDYDASSADLALAAHLAVYTRDEDQIKRIMNLSKLQRDKWITHKNYLRMTIQKALSTQTKRYNEDVPTFKNITDSKNTNIRLKNGVPFLDGLGQMELFKNCVYIASQHKIFDTSVGEAYDKSRFDVMYGGYIMFKDTENKKVHTSAFDAFTKSTIFDIPKAHSYFFRPELPSGTTLYKENGKLKVNLYYPIETRKVKGDPSPFINHIKKLFPDHEDFKIIINYLAAMVQYKGTKFRWAPVIQGVPGNGKTTINDVVQFCLSSEYVFRPTADDTNNKFSGWFGGKLAVLIDDMDCSHANRKVLERLKGKLTDDYVSIEKKGVDQQMIDNRANFIICMNPKDGIYKSDDDRRLAVFFTPQQNRYDLKADGLTGEYFIRLKRWLKHQEGYEIVNDYLSNYPISNHHNPATHIFNAPLTSSRTEAIIASYNNLERVITDAIFDEQPGFMNGYVSVLKVKELLAAEGEKASTQAITKALINLGYVRHPHLKDGKASQIIAEESGRPMIYVKPEIKLSKNGALEAYKQAQGYFISAKYHKK